MALRRQVKNVVKNFSDIEVKVREATSNDPWGPSSSLTSEIADATYNVQAFSETMQLLWKRINDHGKNWRHVYKSLVVLDYIIKTGSDRVAQQCRENIFAIKTLKDFQFIDKDGKDQGINVREKSKQLVALLKDEERLKSERQRALKAKERFYQSEGGIGNLSYPKNKKFQSSKYTESRGSVDDSNLPSNRPWPDLDPSADSRSTDGRIDSEIEKVRPSNEAEEEMQLQIALAMSREEAENGSECGDGQPFQPASLDNAAPPLATLLNLTDATQPVTTTQSMFDPWTAPAQAAAEPAKPVMLSQPTVDPWGISSQPQTAFSIAPPQQTIALPPVAQINAFSIAPPQAQTQQAFTAPPQAQAQQTFTAPLVETGPISDPWSAPPAKLADPWGAPPVQPPPAVQASIQPMTQSVDPWGLPASTSPQRDPFAAETRTLDILSEPSPDVYSADGYSPDVYSSSNSTSSLKLFEDTSSPLTTTNNFEVPKPNVSSASTFLSNGSHLVDVDNILASGSEPNKQGGNPFKLSGSGSGSGLNTNPFLQDKPKAKSINEMRNDKTTVFGAPGFHGNDILLPLQVTQSNCTETSHNPFLS